MISFFPISLSLISLSKPKTDRSVSRIDIGTFTQKIPDLSEKCRKDRIAYELPHPSDRSMDIAEVLKLADQLLFAHTGEHLAHLQETILKGTLQGQKYAKIASENHLSEGHVRDTASELWQALSDALGEDVNKLNVGSILEKVIISNSSIGYLVNGNKVSICSNRMRSPKSSPLSKPTANKPYLDIDTAPEITAFYGRTDELNTLKTWLIQDCTRIITLAGIIGIGKTTLAIKLIE